MKPVIFIILSCLVISSVSCKRSAINIPDDDTPCGPAVIINNEAYNGTETNPNIIKNVTLSGNCLTVTVTASGCSGESWVVKLIDAGAIAKSLPPQRSLKISLDNKELCLAVFTRSYSFDISALKVNGYNKLTLNIDGYKQALTYSY